MWEQHGKFETQHESSSLILAYRCLNTHCSDKILKNNSTVCKPQFIHPYLYSGEIQRIQVRLLVAQLTFLSINVTKHTNF